MEASNLKSWVSSRTPLLCFGTGNHNPNLKEIVVAAAGGHGHSAFTVGNGRENAELGLQVFTNVHNRSDVTAAVAVVGSAPHGDD